MFQENQCDPLRGEAREITLGLSRTEVADDPSGCTVSGGVGLSPARVG